MKVHNLTIDSSQRDTGVYQYANNYVITLENPIYDVSEIRLLSGCIPIPSTPIPRSLILRLSSGSDEFNQSVYANTPYYTGHIIVGERNSSNNKIINGSDDPIVHRFHSGPQKSIKELAVEILYMSGGNIIPYPVGNNDHVFKFEVKCSTDKLEGLPKVPIKEVKKVEDTKTFISIPKKDDPYKWKVYIAAIVIVGILLITLMTNKPKISE